MLFSWWVKKIQTKAGSCLPDCWHPLMERFIFSSEIKRDGSRRGDWWVSDGQNSFGICGNAEKIVASCCSTTGKKGRQQQESAHHHVNVTHLCKSIIWQTVPAKSCLEKKENRFEGLVVWLTSKLQWFTVTSQYVKMFFTVLLKGDVLKSGRFVQLRTLFFLAWLHWSDGSSNFRKIPWKTEKTHLILFKQ